MDIWIAYVLKKYSSPEHPMSKGEIADAVDIFIQLGLPKDNFFAEDSSSRTVARKVDELVMMGELCDLAAWKRGPVEALYRVIGGRVREASGTKRPAKYYFEPILEAGEVSMVCAAIESNHYLSPREIDYLVSRECAALSYQSSGDDIPYLMDLEKVPEKLPSKPMTHQDNSLPPSKASVTLKKIAILQYAIRKELKVRVVPGTYSTRNGKIVFVPKSDTPSILNPYAMLSQNGQFYIIVTHEGHDNPTHYRVDRIYSVELCENKEPKAKSRFKKRDDIPTGLVNYFGRGKKFKADEYTAKYPLMAYYGDTGIRTCTFLCLKDAITVAIDYFGVGDSVTVEETKDSAYVKITVHADYDNVKRFCLQQYSIVRPVFPPELVEQIRQEHMKIVESLDADMEI